MEYSSINNSFFHFMYKIADLMILSILWLVFSLPIVTIPATSSALYYCILKVVREDGPTPAKTFWKAFQDNWKQGCAITGICLGIFLTISAIGSLVYAVSGAAVSLSGIYTIYLILILLIFSWLHYVLSYIAKFQAPLKTVLKNSFVICIANLPMSISMVVLFLLIAGGWLLMIPASALFLLLIPGVYTWITSFLLERIYQKYI